MADFRLAAALTLFHRSLYQTRLNKLWSLGRSCSAIIVSLMMLVNASQAATEFDRQCQRLLPIADEFAKKCLKEAVPFSRMFYPGGGTKGEPEAFSVLFSDAFPNSHFILGCVLDADQKLDFVGLYYKTSTAPLPAFKPEQIGFVDFQDNVGLRINDRKHILIAVRQFVTGFIPQRYGVGVRNCEEGDMEGVTPNPNSSTLVRNAQMPGEWIYSYNAPSGGESKQYRAFFGSGDAPKIWWMTGNTIIDANGALLVPDAWHESACTKWRDVYAETGIVQETCHLQPEKQP